MNSSTHLVEQSWELVHQGQDVNPNDGFLDSIEQQKETWSIMYSTEISPSCTFRARRRFQAKDALLYLIIRASRVSVLLPLLHR